MDDLPSKLAFPLDVLAALSRIHDPHAAIAVVVKGLRARAHTAQVDVWFRRPGDACAECPWAPRCSDRRECLHLHERDGSSEADPDRRRIPLGHQEAGRVAQSGKALQVADAWRDATGLDDATVVARLGVRGFVAVPVSHDGRVTGVLAVWTRDALTQEFPAWLTLVGEHLGATLDRVGRIRSLTEAAAAASRQARRLEAENRLLRRDARRDEPIDPLVGTSAAAESLRAQVDMMAAAPGSLLLTGEPGTGRRRVAWEIHRRSPREPGPFVTFDLRDVRPDLCRTALFGSDENPEGVHDVIAAADGGTLVLLHPTLIPWEVQPAVVRFLREGVVARNGGPGRSVDVRVISISDHPIGGAVDQGDFLGDLAARLSRLQLEVPPLRHRKEDLTLLAENLVDGLRQNGSPVQGVEGDRIQGLSREWRGNLPELEAVIRALAFGPLVPTHSPAMPRAGEGAPIGETDLPTAAGTPGAPGGRAEGTILTETDLRRLERENLRRALNQTQWKVFGADGAAALLGIPPTTLATRMKKLGLRRPKPAAATAG